MGILDRRQFLKAGAAAAAGMGGARRGRSPLWAASEPAGATADAVSGAKNLIPHGDTLQGGIGSLPEGWSGYSGNPALRPARRPRKRVTQHG